MVVKDKSAISEAIGRKQNSRSSSKGVSAVVDYAFICLIVLSFNTVWVQTINVVEYANTIKVIAMLLALIVPIGIFIRQPHLERAEALFFAVIGLGFCVSILLTGDFRAALVGYLPAFLGLFFAVSIKTKERMKQFLSRFVNVIFVLAIISLFFFILGSVLHLIAPTEAVPYEWEVKRSARSYFGLYYETQSIDFLMYRGLRNNGLFTEAPMYNFVLCLALMANALLLKGRKAVSCVLAITVLTTFSTTGYIAVIIVVAYLLLFAPTENRTLKSFRPLLIPIAALGVLCVLAMLLSDKTETGSYSVRSDHLEACIKLFVMSFPVGTGFGNMEAFYELFTYDQGVSVGTMYYLAQGGIFAIVLYVVPVVFALFYGIKMRDGAYVVFQAIFIWLVFATHVNTLPIFWVLMYITLWRYPHLVYGASMSKNSVQGGRGARV